jgi:S-methylmethionine-dependent homocysteine/selenocysteine methylase
MAKYRTRLPQLSDRLFLTDGGMETTLIFHDGLDLPYFAAFDLMRTDAGVEHVCGYYARYAAMAAANELGFILESPTWRASRDWGAKLGYSREELADINRRAIDMMAELRNEFETPRSPMVISGNVGPRGDGYAPDALMSIDDAAEYHAEQIAIFRDSEADMVSAFTIPYAEEAIGIASAARDARMPCVISFTLETDGRLPSGERLQYAIAAVDAETGEYPAYYMINCAHPTHFSDVLAGSDPWLKRLRGLRANASRRSHAELDNSTDLDAGNPIELAAQYRMLRKTVPHLNVLGGCCGTDHRHVEAICTACASDARAAA